MRFRLTLCALMLSSVLTVPVVHAQPIDEVVFVSGTGSEADASLEYENNASPVEYPDDESSLNELANKMADRNRQDGIASSVERVTAALLDMRVGPLAATIENARPGTVRRGVHRDTTIGDLAGRDSDYLPEELGAQSRKMMGMMGGFAQAMAGMMPEVRRMGREMEASIRVAADEARQD